MGNIYKSTEERLKGDKCFILSYDRELEGDMVSYDMSYNGMFPSISHLKYVPAKMLLFISHD